MSTTKNDTKDAKTNWDLSNLFASETDPQITITTRAQKEAVKHFVEKWSNREDYLSEPIILKTALDEYETLHRVHGLFGKYGYYLYLRSALDQVNTDLKAFFNKESERLTHLGNDLQFFELRLSRVPLSVQHDFLTNDLLKPYRHYLERLFMMSPYLLSEPEEKILYLKSQPAYEFWVEMVSEFISTETRTFEGEDGVVRDHTFEEIANLLNSTTKKVRDRAAEVFNDVLNKHLPVAEKELNAILYNKKIDDGLRNTPRADTLRLLNDDLNPDVVDTALQTILQRNDIAQRYYSLKAKLMGVSQMEYHERNVPYGELSTKYPYEKAVELVNDVFTSLDTKFSDIFLDLVTKGAIDVYPKKEKSSGAFCIYNSPTLPVMVLLNHTNKLQDVLTLAHEMGHAINGVLMKDIASVLDYDNPKSTAEVASTFMEDFVVERLMQDANQEERLALMMLKLNGDVSSIFRQTSFYQFEKDLHLSFRAKGYLSRDEIGELFQTHMKNYMGESVKQNEGSQNWWVYVPHFRQFFYVYSYACGQLISKSLQSSFRNDRTFIEKVKAFLSAGSSKSPKELFMELGVDITQKTFWEQGLQEIDDLLIETEALAKKLGKI